MYSFSSPGTRSSSDISARRTSDLDRGRSCRCRTRAVCAGGASQGKMLNQVRPGAEGGSRTEAMTKGPQRLHVVVYWSVRHCVGRRTDWRRLCCGAYWGCCRAAVRCVEWLAHLGQTGPLTGPCVHQQRKPTLPATVNWNSRDGPARRSTPRGPSHHLAGTWVVQACGEPLASGWRHGLSCPGICVL